MKQGYTVAAGLLSMSITGPALAGSDAVAGAIIGAGLGVAIGHSIDGRDGAVIGGSLGAVAGAVLAGDRDDRYRHPHRDRHVHHVRYVEPVYAYAPRHVVHYRPAPVVVYRPQPVRYQPRPVVYYPAPKHVSRVEYRSYKDYGPRYQSKDDRSDWRRDYRGRHWD